MHQVACSYHFHIELIASESSALLRLSIQQVSIQIHASLIPDAFLQHALILVNPGRSLIVLIKASSLCDKSPGGRRVIMSSSNKTSFPTLPQR
jgi:hypothetical protein